MRSSSTETWLYGPYCLSDNTMHAVLLLSQIRPLTRYVHCVSKNVPTFKLSVTLSKLRVGNIRNATYATQEFYATTYATQRTQRNVRNARFYASTYAIQILRSEKSERSMNRRQKLLSSGGKGVSPKNHIGVPHHNFDADQPILIIFRQRRCWESMLSFKQWFVVRLLLTNVSALPGETRTPKILSFQSCCITCLKNEMTRRETIFAHCT